MPYVVQLLNTNNNSVITYIVNSPSLEDAERVFRRYVDYSKRLNLSKLVFLKSTTVEEALTDFKTIVKETNCMTEKLAKIDQMTRNAKDFFNNFSKLDLDEQRSILTQLTQEHTKKY